MVKIVGVRFRNAGKVYYFDPAGNQVGRGQHVVVETAQGLEYGECTTPNTVISDEQITRPLKKVVRLATPDDDRRVEENRRKQKDAFDICVRKIAAHKLDMKLVEVEYTFDNNKILFYFTSDGRVDFRELVKDLASVFRTRIELRQIGVRDEAKMLGGIGICGREFCCSRFLGDFQPVSIKMAKEQSLSLNPVKISGACGRLMCCLKYEQDAYEHLRKITPRVGTPVSTPKGDGVVAGVDLLPGRVTVRFDKGQESNVGVFQRDEVRSLRADRPDKPDHAEKSAKPRNGEEKPKS